jgi:hypothetical protein
MEESVMIYQIFYIKEVFLSRGNKKMSSPPNFSPQQAERRMEMRKVR